MVRCGGRGQEGIDTLVTAHVGMKSDVTKHAQLVADLCEQELAKMETELEQLETEINPALDDNALVAFSYVLGKVVDTMKQVPEVSYPCACVEGWGRRSGGCEGLTRVWTDPVVSGKGLS